MMRAPAALPSRSVSRPLPTYMPYCIELCPCVRSGARTRRSRYLPSLFHAFSEGREGKKNRAACLCGGQDTNLTLPFFSYCNASCTITCGEEHRGIFALTVKDRKTEVWVQVGVPRQLRKVQCGVSKEERRGCKSMRAAVRAFNA